MGVGKTLEELEKDPNFNPDEWEECEEEDNGIIFFWRLVTAMIAISLVGSFFWYLEEYKKRQRAAVVDAKEKRDGSLAAQKTDHDVSSVAYTQRTTLATEDISSITIQQNGAALVNASSEEKKREDTPLTSPSIGEGERLSVDSYIQRVHLTEDQKDHLEEEYQKVKDKVMGDTDTHLPMISSQVMTSSIAGSEHSEEVVLVMGKRKISPELESDSDSEEPSSSSVEVKSPAVVQTTPSTDLPPTPSTELEMGGFMNSMPTQTDTHNARDMALREEVLRDVVSAPPDAPESDHVDGPPPHVNDGAEVRVVEHEPSPPIVPKALQTTPSGRWESEEVDDEEEEEELPSVTTAPEIESYVATSVSGGGEEGGGGEGEVEEEGGMVLEDLPLDSVYLQNDEVVVASGGTLTRKSGMRAADDISGEVESKEKGPGRGQPTGQPPTFTSKPPGFGTAEQQQQREAGSGGGGGGGGGGWRSRRQEGEDSMGFTEESESSERKLSSMLEVVGVSSMAEALKKIESLKEVSDIMRRAGLQSSNLIFGIDYTASNKYQGEMCFGGKSLHSIAHGIPNPYQQVISIMGKTLAPFATSGYIPAFGFGDVHTSDWSVFPLKQGEHCRSFDEVLEVYNAVTPKIILSGPTNFAPLIYQAMDICQEHHDVTNERATRRAIVDACKFPLSIVVVGVGDGPWDMMRVFDESLPKRPWDNFHFVEFNKIMEEAEGHSDLTFAVQSLLEIPDQYKKIQQMGLIG